MTEELEVKEPDFDVIIDPTIFNDVYLPWLNNTSRVQIIYGGASSGKSHFAVGQRPVIDLLAGGRNYLVCRQVGKTIRRSVFNQVIRTIADFGVGDLFTVNKSEFTITCANGYQMFFVGLDDVEKVKSIIPEQGAITDIVIEEATETEKNTVKQLMKRQRGGREDVPKRLTMLFNPIVQEHWIFQEYFSPVGWADTQTEYYSDSLSILKTWYVHNKYLTTQDVFDLEHEEDRYFYNVYTLGNWGVLGNLIFSNWSIEDLSGRIQSFYNFRNGLDFGYSSAPAAIGRSHWDKRNKTIYFFDEFYDTEMTNDELATECLRMFGKETVTCDSEEPKSIQELKNAGVNAKAARKGKDSVSFGIQWLQGTKIIIDKKCINMQNELRQYKWLEGDDGKPKLRNGKPVPVDNFNHLIDQLRYAFEDDMLESPQQARAYKG
jgi:phage terminase large subunit